MVRLATAQDYHAVSELLSNRSKFPNLYKELITFLVTAGSKLNNFSSLKIAVVVNHLSCIIGCVLIDDAPCILHARQVCVSRDVDFGPVLLQIYRFVEHYAKENGYHGFSLSVDRDTYLDFLKEHLTCNTIYYESQRRVRGLKSLPKTDNIQKMNKKHIAVLKRQDKPVKLFAKLEKKLLIWLTQEDLVSVKSFLDYKCELSESHIDKKIKDISLFTEYILTVDLETYLTNSVSEKFVYLVDGLPVGYIIFSGSDNYIKNSAKIMDLYVLPKYTNTDVASELILFAGNFVAKHNYDTILSSFICEEASFLHRYYNATSFDWISANMVFLFEDLRDKTFEGKTSIFG